MSVNFAVQSRSAVERRATTEVRFEPRTSAQWAAYFRANAAKQRLIAWERGAETAPAELAAIARSLQAWQLGETSDGRHLRAAATRYAERIGDPYYAVAVELFIREEQRHGELLGRYLDLAGPGRVGSDFGDRLFRAARYCLVNVEVWTTPVVMVETMALIYYNAVRRSTKSAVLRAICGQILADEVPHLQFQCERLASLLKTRSPFLLALTMLAHRGLFLAIVVLIWICHRKALRAGGYSRRDYWRAAWRKMDVSWRLMDPARYRWQQWGEGAGAAPSCRTNQALPSHSRGPAAGCAAGAERHGDRPPARAGRSVETATVDRRRRAAKGR
jgi:hypothetical protein